MLDVPIGLIDDPEGRTIGLPDSSRVQLAVRLSEVIRIQQSAWDHLNEANKVALILHEAFYSLIVPTFYKTNRNPDGTINSIIKIQSSRNTRELVGLAFDVDRSDKLLNLSINYLGLNFLGSSGASGIVPKWNIKLVTAGNITMKEFTFAFSDIMPVSSVQIFITETCQSAIESQSTSGSQSPVLSGVLSQSMLYPTSVSYDSPFGDQTAVAISPVDSNSLGFQRPLVDQTACENTLGAYLDQFKSLGLVQN
jgi:hypothetical protein